MRPWERDATGQWRRWLAEPQPPLSGAQMLARARLRLNAFCFGIDADDAKAPDWPLNPAQERAIAEASEAQSGPERLRVVADILDASPMFDWFSSIKSCVKAGVDPGDRFYRAFHRIDLDDGVHCMPNVGIVGPECANPRAWAGFTPRIAGWNGRWPRALALDARGWAAVLWANPRNLWRWWPTAMLDGQEQNHALWESLAKEGIHDPACIDVGGGWVGTAQFTQMRGFDGAGINEAAGRILGLSPERTQWLGGAAGEAGPYWMDNLTGRHLAQVCRDAAEGAHPKALWATLSEGVRRLMFDPVPYP